MHNQHVITYLGHRSRLADAALARLRAPGGNLAMPFRYEARLWAHRLVIETVRQYAPEHAVRCGPWTPKSFYQSGAWAS